MSYGCTTTGLGAPVGGATSSYGSTSSYPSYTGSSTGSSLNLGSTFGSNFWGSSGSSLWNQGLTDIYKGYNELGQSGALGSSYGTTSFEDFMKGCGGSSSGLTPGPLSGGSTGSSPGPLSGGSTGSTSGSNSGLTSFDDFLKGFGDTSTGNTTTGNTNTTGGNTTGGTTPGGDNLFQTYDQFWANRPSPIQLTSFDDFMKSFDAPGQAQQNTGGATGGTPAGLTSFEDWLKGFDGGNTGAANPVANLVGRATNDARLTPAVTQIANDPVGNQLLNGAVNAGLQGIQVANLPAGFYGQFLPDTKQIQIAPMTLTSNDLLRTIAHELVHAATPGNGDSLNEENTADQIGTALQRRVTGQGPGYVLGGNSYNGLPQDNGILNSLRLLGINI